MKQHSFFAAAFIGALFLSTGCEKKIEVKAPKPVAAAKAPIKIETVRGPEKKDCGGFQWDVKFTLDKPSAKGGWIVQQITWDPKILNCDGSLKEGPAKVYWEAWEIGAGKDADAERLAGTYDYDDRYSSPSHPKTKGKLTISGELMFFEGLALPAAFKKNNADTYAGGLPATAEKPAFWNNKDMVAHNLSTAWHCCDDSTKFNSLTTTPNGGRKVNTYTPDLSKLDAYGKMIYSIPAWTMGYDNSMSNQLYNISRQLSTVPYNSLRNSMANYARLFARSDEEIDAMSKVYLLLRVLYQLPVAAERSQVKVFGGFIHPSIENMNAPFNMSYPVASTGNYYENPISVNGEYRGFLGRGYDAVGEFDYFNEIFARRSF